MPNDPPPKDKYRKRYNQIILQLHGCIAVIMIENIISLTVLMALMAVKMGGNVLLTFSDLHTAILSMMSLKSSLYLAGKDRKI